MALFNYTTKEITIKIVYYGPGLSGKTTNLQYLHSILNTDRKGKLVSLPTETDRTLFFDLLPVDFGKIRDFSIRLQLYTVPGQVRYNATRKLVLKGADAVVFVADSQHEMKEQNIESLKNMRENLIANNINPDEIPLTLQYNKRDLRNILSLTELNKDLNEQEKYSYVEAIAINGMGVEYTFHYVTNLVINDIKRKQGIDVPPVEEVKKDIEIKEGFGIGTDVTLYEEEPIPIESNIDSSLYKSFGFVFNTEEPTLTTTEQEDTIEQQVHDLGLEPTMEQEYSLEQEPTIEQKPSREHDYGFEQEPTTDQKPSLMQEYGLEQESTMEQEPPIEKGYGFEQEPTTDQKPSLQKRVDIKEDKDLSYVEEKLDTIINAMNLVVHTLKDLNIGIRDMVKEQKQINDLFKAMGKSSEKSEKKKSWWFS